MRKNPLDIALFDMDGSLADYEGALLRELEALRSPLEEPLIAGTLWEAEELPHIKRRMSLVKSLPGFWYNLQPIQVGIDAIAICRKFGFDVQILTKGPRRHPNAWDEKVRWCQAHLGDLDIHVTSDKGLVYGKVLYDDYPPYMVRWLEHRPRGLGIMPITASNKDFRHPNVLRWDGSNYQQFADALVAARDRGPGQELDVSWNKL